MNDRLLYLVGYGITYSAEKLLKTSTLYGIMLTALLMRAPNLTGNSGAAVRALIVKRLMSAKALVK